MKLTDQSLLRLIYVLIGIVSLFILSLFIKLQDIEAAFSLPKNSGGWLYAYQSLLSGIFAIFGGYIAYLGVLKSIKWHEESLKREKQKIIDDLKADSSFVIFILLLTHDLVTKDETKLALEMLEERLPLKLGYKFCDNASIEKLESMKRINIREMITNLDEFNTCMQKKEFGKAAEARSYFYFNYENVFGDDFETMKNLSKAFTGAIAAKLESKKTQTPLSVSNPS